MAIAFVCEGCSKTYEVPDSLAGKKGKCKQCGHVFRIPAPVAAMAVEDIYGLDEPASLARAEPVEEAAPMRRGGAKPTRAAKAGAPPKKKKKGVDSENQSQFRGVGIKLLVGGGLVFALPFLGLQIRGVHALPAEAQAGVGFLMVVGGVVMLALSAAGRPMRMLGFAAGGLAGLVVLIVLLATVLPRRNGNPPGPNFPAGAIGGPGVAGNPAFGGPPPGSAGGGGVEAKISLSNGKAAREPGPGTIISNVVFKADYKFDSGSPPVRPLSWLIESPRTKPTMPFVHLDQGGGSLSGAMIVTDGDQGPYQCYLGAETFGPGGPSYEKVSNTLSMQWMGDSGLEPQANPAGRRPGFPGPPPGFPGGAPPTPPFGPMGPRGPRGRP